MAQWGIRKDGKAKMRQDLTRREPSMGESQLTDLQNMRVLLEEARVLARNLAYHRRASVEAKLGGALDEIDQQIADLRSNQS
jgi:hypothetical protein